MLKANRKRLRNGNQEESMLDVRIDIRTHPTLKLSKDMNCSSQCPRPAKRACVDLATDNARILQDLDPVHISAHGTTEVSKRPQTRGHIGQFRKRYNAFGTDVIEINATGDSSQEARRLQTRSSSFQLKSYHHPTAITPTREAIKVAEVPNVVNDNGGNSALKSALESLKALVDEQFECPICLDTCTDTHINPKCLHRFCGDCIKESLRKCNNECPSCRVHIPTKRTLRKDKRYDTIVSAPMCQLKTFKLLCCPPFLTDALLITVQVQGVLGSINALEKHLEREQNVNNEVAPTVTDKSEDTRSFNSSRVKESSGADEPLVINGSNSLSYFIGLLKVLVDEQFECPICLETCTNTHINPKCLHRVCGNCIEKESNTECLSCIHIPTKRTLHKDSQFDDIVSASMRKMNCDVDLFSPNA